MLAVGGRLGATVPTVPTVLAQGAAVTQQVDPSILVDGPGVVRAAGSFAAVLLFGGLALHRYEGLVDRSIDASMEQPVVSILYGVMAYVIVVVCGAYALTQLVRLGMGGTVVLSAAVVVVGGVLLGLSGLGFAVVGGRLTELEGERRPWTGLVAVAVLSAAGWLVLPPLAGLAAWIVVAAAGIGGPTRRWIHVPKTRPSGD